MNLTTKSPPSVENETLRWGYQIIDLLVKQGVTRFCLSPGSRSTPLAHAITRHPEASTLIHFDERGAAFHAFGFAKGSGKPVALLCTSGSAVGNFFPAVMEAAMERVPLVILTADRPPELQNCGANQSCDQVKIFGNYVRFSCEIPPADSLLDNGYLSSTISYAILRATHPLKGPVHLNCAFREPFFSTEEPLFPHESPIIYTKPHLTLTPEQFSTLAEKMQSARQGVIVVGLVEEEDCTPILDLAEKLQWPLLADILSGLRRPHPCVIAHFDLLLKHKNFQPDFILHLGDRIVSKTVAEWLKNVEAENYFLVAGHSDPHDPTRSITERIICSPSHFCTEIESRVHQKSAFWLKSWKDISHLISTQIDLLLKDEPASEPSLIRFLHHHLPSSFALFIANSMPIRDADQLFFSPSYKGKIFGKRGLSGIDGNIATAAGIAESIQRPLLALLGDLSALHDINSLPQLHHLTQPVIILCINNQGGGIFSFLPIASQEKKEDFEAFFAAAHPFDFKAAAELFHLPYLLINDPKELLPLFSQEKSYFVELKTDREKNHHLHKEVNSCLHSFMAS